MLPAKGQSAGPGESLEEQTLVYVKIEGADLLADGVSSRGAEGVEEFTGIVNNFFEQILKTIDEFGGTVMNFSAHSLLASFKSSSPESRFAAATCAWHVCENLGNQNSREKGGGLNLGIRIATGAVKDFRLGSDTRLLRLVTGETARRAYGFGHNPSPFKVFMTPEVPDGLQDHFDLKKSQDGFEIVKLLKFCEAEPKQNSIQDIGRGTEAFLPKWLVDRVVSLPEEQKLPGDYRYGTLLCTNFWNVDEDFKSTNEYVNHTLRVITKYGGTVERLEPCKEGCLITGLFGIPLAAEDDEKRASLAARELISSSPGGASQRTGISSGFIFSSVIGSDTRKTFTVAGRRVRNAMIAMESASEREVLVTRQVKEQIKSMFTLSQAPLKTGDLNDVYVLGERRVDVNWLIPPDEPLIGRKKELAYLFDLMGRVAQTKSGLAVTLSGEEGVGKIRLVQEFCERARKAAFTVAGGRAASFGRAIPYLPWIDLFRVLLAEGKGIVEHRALERALHSIERPDWLPLLASLVGLDSDDNEFTRSLGPQERKQKIFAMLLELITHYSGENPLLLVFDDCDWMDSLSCELTAGLIDIISDFPILLVMLSRPSTEPQPWNETKVHSELRILPLDRENSDLLVEAKLRAMEVDPALSERVWNLSHGNPLFIDEFLRLLESTSALKKEGSRAFLVPGAEIGTLPPNIKRVLSARIDLLNERAKNLLAVASVIGQTFEFDVLNSIQETANNDALERQLSLLEHHGLLSRSKDAQALWAFKNFLTREAAYDSLPFEQSRLYHEKLARLLESKGLPPSQILEHYAHTKDEEKILEYLVSSAEKAAAQFANKEAVKQYREAAKLLSRRKDRANILKRFEVLLEIERIDGLMGHRDEQAGDLKTLLMLALSLEDESKLGMVLSRETSFFYTVGDYLRALEKGIKAEELLERTGAEEELVVIIIALTRILEALGRFSDALKRLDNAKSIADRLGKPSLKAMVASEFSSYYQLEGNYREALKFLNVALSEYRKARDTNAEGRIAGQLGIVYKYLGLYEQARSSYNTALDLAVKTGDQRKEATLLGNLSIINKNMGDYEKALEYGARALEIARRIKDLHGEGTILDTLGNVNRALGRFEEAIENLSGAIKIAQETGEKPLESKHLSNLANVYSELGDYEKALELENRSVDISREVGAKKSEALSLLKLAALEGKDARHTESLIRKAAKMLEETGAEALYLDSLVELASHHVKSGNLVQANAEADKALSAARKKSLYQLEAAALRIQAEAQMAQRDASAAFFLSGRALSVLKENGLRDTKTFLIHARVLSALGKFSEAVEIVDELYADIMAKAGRIENTKLKKSFLESVDINAEISALWNKLHHKKSTGKHGT